MKIDDLSLPNNISTSRFKYGIKFTPEKSLNKFLDYMLIIVKNDFDGKESYNICFKKSFCFNNFLLQYDEFKKYAQFLKECGRKILKCERIQEVFNIKGSNKRIEIVSLDEENFKLCSVKENERVFFLLDKCELEQFSQAILSIFRERTTIRKFSDSTNDFLTDKNKNIVYLEALYILLDNVLDNKNKERFEAISEEINKIKKLKL